MNARRCRIWVMGALLASMILPPTRPTAAALSSFADIRQVQERGALRVGLVAKDIPPLLMTVHDGQPAAYSPSERTGASERNSLPSPAHASGPNDTRGQHRR